MAVAVFRKNVLCKFPRDAGGTFQSLQAKYSTQNRGNRLIERPFNVSNEHT